MAVESIRGNLSTTGHLRGALAAGGGSDVSIIPTYDSGIKIADFSIDGSAGAIYVPEPETNIEVIDITAGNDTTSRTFAFNKIPKKISMQYIANGWCFYRSIIWGCDRSFYQASQLIISDTSTYIGVSGISCDDANKTMIITGLNAIQAANTSDIVGKMIIEY